MQTSSLRRVLHYQKYSPLILAKVNNSILKTKKYFSTSAEITGKSDFKSGITNRCMQLSPLDYAMPSVYVYFLFVYNNPCHSSFEKESELIRNALDRLSEKYPALCGVIDNVDEKTIGIKIPNKGEIAVELNPCYPKTREECGFAMDDQWENRPNDLCLGPSALENRTFGVQLTKFACNSIGVGISFHHKFTDGGGTAIILQQLNKLIKGEEINIDCTINRKKLFLSFSENMKESKENDDFTSLPVQYYANLPTPGETPSLKTHYFRMNFDALQSLKETLSQEGGVKLSINDVACGWYWKLMIDAAPSDEPFDWSFLFPMDYRNRSKFVLPNNYIGNTTLISRVSKVAKKSDVSLLGLCQLIRQKIQSLSSDESDILEKLNWLRSQEKNPDNILASSWRPQSTAGVPDVLITNLSRIPFYDIRIIDSKPIYAGIAPFTGLPGLGIIQPMRDSPDLTFVTVLPETGPLYEQITSSPLFSQIVKN